MNEDGAFSNEPIAIGGRRYMRFQGLTDSLPR